MATIHPDVARRLPEIRALAREYGIERMDVFGSSCTPEFDPARSDFDFLAKFPEGYDFGPWLGRLQEFEERLAELLERDVDVAIDSERVRGSLRAFAAEPADPSALRPGTLWLLAEALDECRSIEEWMAGIDLAAFAADVFQRSAVERALGIIGTKLERLNRFDPATAGRIDGLGGFVGLRDHLARSCGDADPRRVFDAATVGVPALRAQLARLAETR